MGNTASIVLKQFPKSETVPTSPELTCTLLNKTKTLFLTSHNPETSPLIRIQNDSLCVFYKIFVNPASKVPISAQPFVTISAVKDPVASSLSPTGDGVFPASAIVIKDPCDRSVTSLVTGSVHPDGKVLLPRVIPDWYVYTIQEKSREDLLLPLTDVPHVISRQCKQRCVDVAQFCGCRSCSPTFVDESKV